MLAMPVILSLTQAALNDGTEVLLRPMTPDDCQALRSLFATATEADVRYLRDDVRDPAVVQGWCEHVDYGRVLPLTAFFQERAVGQASLHVGCGPDRHCAQMRLFVAPDFRRRGLGTHLLKALIDVARQRHLHQLMAEIVSDQSWLIRACLHRGFELCYTLPDAFMFPDGSTQGVTILRLCLQPPGVDAAR
jgi:GNAT superfamily N-acetyltransferase